VLSLTAGSGIRAQVLPNADSLIPFAPITYNGPLAGVGGIFMFGSFDRAANGITFWVVDGNTGAQVPYPAAFPAAVPFTVGPANEPDLGPLLLHNGLAPPPVDPAEDDNPQGLGGTGGVGGRTMHQRRHHLVPANQDLVPWLVADEAQGTRLLVSTVAKPNVAGAVMEGGVLTIDYMGYPMTAVPPVASSVWPTPTGIGGANLPPAAPPVLAVPYVPAPPGGIVERQVLSDLAPNVYSTFNPAAPNSMAWVTGNQAIGDTPMSPTPGGLLVLADWTVAGAAPNVTSAVLGSRFSPYADKILVWNDIGGYLPLPQYVLVPCRDGVEIYDPAPAGAPAGTPPALVKVVPTAAGKEICSNVSFFGPANYDAEPPTAYFIVLERSLGETQPAGGGVNFIVFDLLPGSIPSPGPVSAAGTLPGLLANSDRPPLDVVRGLNDIAIAPPARGEDGSWQPALLPGATAWFGVWDANTAVAVAPPALAPPFGAMVGVENCGLAAYADNGLGFNTAGPFPVQPTNVRYFTPVRDGAGSTFAVTLPPLEPAFPVPVGEVSTNPILNPFSVPAGIVNQNLVAWYWDNGVTIPDPVTNVGTGFGVAILDVIATWRNANPAYPGGILVDGTAGDAAPPASWTDRSHETITERPLFGYVNYPFASILFAQRQCGIETLGAALIPGSPRSFTTIVRFPQNAPPRVPVEWLYQKRRHTAWNPPSPIHPQVNAAGNTTTWGIDTVVTVEATEAWMPAGFNDWPRGDDWVSYFVDWRFDPILGLTPWPQGFVFPDWASPRAGPNVILLGAIDATTAPPPTEQNFAFGGFVGYPYCSFNGQTPLWADWAMIGSAFYPGLEYRPVLRSHVNPFPIMNAGENNAWVGLGAEQMIKYSFGVNNVPSAMGWPLAAAGAPSIIALHIDQIGPGAGLPPIMGGPGQFRVNVLHYQATQPGPLGPSYPAYEATLVNNAGAVDWQILLPAGEIVSTEILAFTPP
jgi:hypothetical protein